MMADEEKMEVSLDGLFGCQDSVKDRVPLADLTFTPTTMPSSIHRSETRKRSQEEVPLNNITPPNSMRLRPDVISNEQTPGIFKFRRRVSNQPPIDFFKVYPIPAEVLRNVMKYLNKKDICSAMQTNQFFYKAGTTSDNWDWIDFHNRHIQDTYLATILERKVKVCRLSDAKVSATDSVPMSIPLNPDGSRYFYTLTHLDLGRVSFGRIEALTSILGGCKLLEGLCLESIDFHQEGDKIGEYIGQNTSLRFLDLSLTRGMTTKAVEAIVQGCRRLTELNVAWCGLDKLSVRTLVEKLPTSLKKINMSGTLNKAAIEDEDVEKLVQRCRHLDEVDLSDNSNLTDRTVLYLVELKLTCLSLNRCYSISPHMYLECQQINYLNVFGTMTDQGYQSLNDQLSNTHVNSEVLSYIAKPTVPPAVSSIWLQRTRDIY